MPGQYTVLGLLEEPGADQAATAGVRRTEAAGRLAILRLHPIVVDGSRSDQVVVMDRGLGDRGDQRRSARLIFRVTPDLVVGGSRNRVPGHSDDVGEGAVGGRDAGRCQQWRNGRVLGNPRHASGGESELLGAVPGVHAGEEHRVLVGSWAGLQLGVVVDHVPVVDARVVGIRWRDTSRAELILEEIVQQSRVDHVGGSVAAVEGGLVRSQVAEHCSDALVSEEEAVRRAVGNCHSRAARDQ